MQGLKAGHPQAVECAQLEAGLVAVLTHQHAGHVRVGQHALVLVHHSDLGARHQPQLSDLAAQVGERNIQADHSTAVFAGLAQRNADLLRGEKHIGGSEDLRVLFCRLGIPRAGPGVIAVAGAHGGIDETQLCVVIVPAPHQAHQTRRAALPRHRLHQECSLRRRLKPCPQRSVAQRTHEQKLPVGIPDEDRRQQSVLLQQAHKHRQAAQPRLEGGGRSNGIKREQPQRGIRRVDDMVHPLADQQADVLRTVVRRRDDGLPRAGAYLVDQEHREQQHGRYHHRGNHHLERNGDAPPPGQFGPSRIRRTGTGAVGGHRLLRTFAQGVHALECRGKAGFPSPYFWQKWLPHHSGWCRYGDRYISPVAA